MRINVLLISLLLSFFVQPNHARLTFQIESTGTSVPGLQTSSANTPGKDQYGDGPPVTRNGQMHLQFTAKDNDGTGNAMSFQFLRLNRRVGATRTLVAEDATARSLTADFTWWSVNVPTSLFNLQVGDTILWEWEIQFSDFAGSHHNFYYIRTLVSEPLPVIPGFRRADFHVHGDRSDDQIHVGINYNHMAEVGKQVGLDAIGVTDHSPNLLPSDWTRILNKVAELTTEFFVMLVGEELTTDDNETNEFPDGRRHIVGLGLSRLLPAPEECCTDNANGQLWTQRQAYDSIGAQNGVAFAAHPTDGVVFPNEGTLGVWDQASYDLALSYPVHVFAGLEFFNERRTTFNYGAVRDDFVYPYAWQHNPNWDSRWQNGMNRYLQLVQQYLNPPRPTALAGSSDSHQTGYESYFEGPDDIGVYANGLGAVHSLVYAPGPLSANSILNGLKQAAVIMSDGPGMGVWVDTDGNGTDDGTVGGLFTLTSNARLRIDARSINEFGPFNAGRLIRVRSSRRDTIPLSVNGLTFSLNLPLYAHADPSGWTALIVELRTTGGYRTVASPVYLAPRGFVQVTANHSQLALLPPSPNPARHQVSFAVSVPSTQSVKLVIYDLAGREIHRLYAGQLEPGTRTFVWQPRQSSGKYYVRLITEKTTLSRSFTLLH